MKILFFMENTRPGGLDTFLVTLIDHWPCDSDELVLICNRHHPGLDVIARRLKRPLKIIRHGLPIHSALESRVHKACPVSAIARALSGFLRYGLFAYYLLHLPALLRRQKADRLFIVAGGYPGGDTCRAAAIVWGILGRKPRAVFSFHNLAMPARWHVKPIEYAVDILMAWWSGSFVTVSRAAAHSMNRRPILARTRRISYVHYGIEPPLSSGDGGDGRSLRSALRLPASARICLMLATYERRKGHHFLLQSFCRVVREIPSAHLVMCGYGHPHERRSVVNFAQRLGLSKHVHTFGFRNDTALLLKNADLLVMPSQEYESFGLSSLEAMAHKVPVVTTQVGGLPEVVRDDEGGYCVPPDDVEGYASKIVLLLKDERLRRQQGERGYRRFQNLFQAKRMATIYARMIRGKGDSSLTKTRPTKGRSVL